MPKKPLTKDSQFIVGEEKILNYILALLFFGLFLYGAVDAIRRNFVNIDYQSYVFALAIIPAAYCLRRGFSQRVYIRINAKGIYHHEKLVTRWEELVKVYLAQKEKTGLINLQDNFLLVLEYRKQGEPKLIRRNLPLTNTQNKSEEEVLRAVNFFWKQYRLDTIR